jgi:hypothetical protein
MSGEPIDRGASIRWNCEKVREAQVQAPNRGSGKANGAQYRAPCER